ncbi:6-phosphofructokinase [Aestuariimicrobium sp. T2.26MG-19.2B]|uniref:6-phosphofructokinase n=1 Tax=Aestuariimicrobium sp. T2.26MG-19.2B TaxID=3040679 RepID=UPI0024777119|nr:6-phosphofructokinase [Aestuariimicrobium sp. T2.26MG-19.2B]CAI9403986.1 ATP-dependent 6-phosphofructokinase [Aestuariimicrobium sp. T2.26MG-19.2B]
MAASGSVPRLGILTSGGDAQGMNAAVRAVVRTALSMGAEAFAIYEGYQGMIEGGDGIKQFSWDDVGSVLHRGGTVIGTFRSLDFKERWGRKKAAANLVDRGIDRLIVIGGDGSLSGLDLFSREWPGLLDELVAEGRISQTSADAHPALMIAGLVGSIDNDLVGTETTIGADSALHRIIDALDALSSTSASHQRRFVVEVMGRHCGYLALMSAIAGGCDWVFVPENPPADGWEDRMAAALSRGRAQGRRESMVIVAEGAQDRHGTPITARLVADVIKDKLDEDARITILGHVQRGGRPSAYDRWASTWLGYKAVHQVLAAQPGDAGTVLGIRGNRVAAFDLVEAVERTRQVPVRIQEQDFEGAMQLRGGSFHEMADIFDELNNPEHVESSSPDTQRIAVLHAGGLAPGMNTAAEAAVRLGLSRGFSVLGVRNGFDGLRDGDLTELGWGDVEGWMGEGGANLGTKRDVPEIEHLYSISRAIEENRISALLVVGGFNAYEGAWLLNHERDRYPAFNLPIVCVPASIDNNLPGSELSVGADTALNAITESIDRIKQSGTATKRCFVIETMGRQCGYLAAIGGLAGGAERIYLHEEGITLDDLVTDLEWMRDSFATGRRLFLAVRSEGANDHYTTDFLARLFDEGGGDLFDVRQSILGHLQQGGNPTPFDRLLAVRLVSRALNVIGGQFASGKHDGLYVGLTASGIETGNLAHFHEVMDMKHRRPLEQWWLELGPIVQATAHGPGA